jgi:hypothetical protein
LYAGEDYFSESNSLWRQVCLEEDLLCVSW